MVDATTQNTDAQLVGQVVHAVVIQGAKAPENVAAGAQQIATSVVLAGKKWYQSKTIWLAIVAEVAVIVQFYFGLNIDVVAAQAVAIPMINAALRFSTKEPLTA